MASTLKKLVQTVTGTKTTELPVEEVDRQHLETYYQAGYNESKKAQGSAAVFKDCLFYVYEQFKDKCVSDVKLQQTLSQPYLQEKASKEVELRKRETALSIKEDDIGRNEEDVKKLEFDIAHVKQEPEKYGLDVDKKPKAQFYIGIMILLPITLYLIVFYISASYSAFFKDFETSSLNAAIFDANALTKAFQDGWLESVFVGTIPFAFMGLGYLIHMFMKEKGLGRVKIALLFVVTFIFDAILAYQIEKKIYDFEKTLDSPPFDLGIAVQEVPFWGIIFAGFVVYIIWGLVFDFIMKEYEQFDKIQSYIRTLKEKKTNLLEDQKKIQETINAIKQEIADLRAEVLDLQQKINGKIFPSRRYRLYHSEYRKGWLLAIMEELHIPREKKEALVERCKAVANEHLIQFDVAFEDNGLNTQHHEDE